jgi:hypothetical protein
MGNAQAHRTDACERLTKPRHPETLEKRLRAYAAGAGAVAAGLVASASLGSAEIVVVPTHVTVLPYSSFPINIDGTTALTLAIPSIRRTTTTHYCVEESLFATAASGAGVVGHGPKNQVAALKFGAVIGPADQFQASKQVLASGISCRDFGWGVGGPFANTTNRFLGFKFELNGQVYYGWAGFGVVFPAGGTAELTAVLTAYAYETKPNTPIYAGQSSDGPRESRLLPIEGSARDTAKVQPATLGLLALGHLGLNAWRRRENQEPDACDQPCSA